jgi:CcmD family protein
MTTSEKYVTAAYLVVFAVVLAYLLIMATKLARLGREVAELEELAAAQRPVRAGGPVEGGPAAACPRQRTGGGGSGEPGGSPDEDRSVCPRT